jgi:hypothetical protein
MDDHAGPEPASPPQRLGWIATVRAMPPGVQVFLGYAFLVLGVIALSLRTVVEQAVLVPISPLGVVIMGLLAYTIFAITLTLQRKEAARTLDLGLASLTVPAVPLLILTQLPIEAAFVALVAVALFAGLTRPGARAWFSEP